MVSEDLYKKFFLVLFVVLWLLKFFLCRLMSSRHKVTPVSIHPLLPRLHSFKHMPVSSDYVNKQVCVGSSKGTWPCCCSWQLPVSSEKPRAAFLPTKPLRSVTVASATSEDKNSLSHPLPAWWILVFTQLHQEMPHSSVLDSVSFVEGIMGRFPD